MKNLFTTTFVVGAMLFALLLPRFGWSQNPTAAVAFLYDSAVHGKKLHTGEVFRDDRLVAGHPTLPRGSILRLTNPANRKKVDVLVNHRWQAQPSGVVISRIAAKSIGMDRGGRIEYQVLTTPWQTSTKTTAAVRRQPEKSVTTTEGLYFLEFAAYKSRLEATRLAKALTRKGAPCKVAEDKQGIFHVISDGYFTSLEDASEVYYKLSDRGEYVPQIKKIN